jgi:hypothetical protein
VIRGPSRIVTAAAIAVCATAGCKGQPRPPGLDGGNAYGNRGADPQTGAHPIADAAAADAAPPPDDAVLPPSGDGLMTRARHLVEAIVADDGSLASDILFPRDGWLATRDAVDPGKDWQKHVADPFRRSVRALSRSQRGLDHAQVVSLEIGAALAPATPRPHGWRKALWVANGSRLTFVVDGHTRTLAIREMVAWRGAWYVTKLR